jgi:hypothetical protein
MQQPVTLGQRHGDLVVINSGISAGDEVVTTGQMLLQPGSPVMVVEGGPTPPVVPAVPKVGPKTLQSPNNEGAAKPGPAASAKTSTEGGRS